MLHYGIKNFRKFDSKGCELSIAPITFFTGCNNSGKSTMSKSLILLSQMFNRVFGSGGNYLIEEYYIDFSDRRLHLGDYSKVLNNKAAAGDFISFSYSSFSDLLHKELLIELDFAKRESEQLNRAHLKSFRIFDDSGKGKHQIICGDVYGRYMTYELVDFSYEPWFYKSLLELFPKDVIERNKKVIKQYTGIDVARIKEREYFQAEEIARQLNLLPIIYDDTKSDMLLLDICTWIKGVNEAHIPYTDELFVKSDSKLDCLLGLIKMARRLAESGRTGRSWFLNKNLSLSSSILLLAYIYQTSSTKSFFDFFSDFKKEGTIYSFLSQESRISYPERPLEHYDYREDSIGQYYRYYKDELNKIIKNTKPNELSTSIISSFIQSNPFLKDCLVFLHSDLTDDFYESIRCLQGEDKYLEWPRFEYFVELLLREVFTTYSSNHYNLNNIKYIGTTAISVKRLYQESERNDLLTDLIMRCKSQYTFTNKWLWKLGLGNRLEIQPAEEGVGFFIYIVSNRGGHEKKTLMADLGYGVCQMIVILLLADAYGGSTLVSYPTIILEEPEVHLHPSFQSLLADVFLDAYESFHLHFIIETHSEYLLRKTQVLVANKKYETNAKADANCPFRAYYFPKTGKPYSLGYRKDGYFVNSFGKGFYDESSSLTFELL